MQCWHAASKTWIHEQSSSKTASSSAALKLGNLLNRASSRQQPKMRPNMTTARAKACPRKQAARQEGGAAALMTTDERQSMKTRRRVAARQDGVTGRCDDGRKGGDESTAAATGRTV